VTALRRTLIVCAGIVACAWLWSAGALADVAGKGRVSGFGRELILEATETVADLKGRTAPAGFSFLTVRFFLLPLASGIEDLNVGSTTSLVEDGAFVYRPDAVSAEVDPTFSADRDFAAQVPVAGALVFLVPEQTGQLSLVHETPAGRLELAVTGKPAAQIPEVATEALLAGPLTKDNLEAAIAGVEFVKAVAGKSAPAGRRYLVADFRLTNRAEIDRRVTLSDFVMLVEDGRYLYPLDASTAELSSQFTTKSIYAPGIDAQGKLVFQVPAQTGDLALVVFTAEGSIILDLTPSVAAPAPLPILRGPSSNATLVATLHDWREAPELEPPSGEHVFIADLTVALNSDQQMYSVDFDAQSLIAITDADGTRIEPAPLWDKLSRPFRDPALWTGQPAGGSVAFLIPNSALDKPLQLNIAGGKPPISFDLPGPTAHSASEPAETTPGTPPEVAATPSLRLVTDNPQSGQTIVVLFDNLASTPKNWIALAAADSADDKYLQYSYTGDAAAGRLQFDPQSPGNYEIRAYYNDSFKVETRLAFKIAAEPSQASGQVLERHALPEPDPSALAGLTNVADRKLGAFAQAAEGWEFMLDGNTAGYDETKGTTVLSPDWPNRIWLARPYAIDRIRILLCNLDQRTYRYKLEGSPDGVAWSVISESVGATGWLDIPLDGRSFIAFRFSDFGTDAADGKFCLVEFAAYTPDKIPPPATLALPSDDSETPWQDRPAEKPLNVALAALGAKAEGGSSPNNIIDGDHSDASRSEVPLGEPLTVTLDRAYELAMVRISLPVTGDRAYRYRLEGSLDGDKWELLADRTQADQSGVQEVDLAGRSLKAVRIIGTAAPSNEAFALNEVEMLASGAVPITSTAAALSVQNETSDGNLALALHGGRVEKVSSRLDALRDELHLIDGLPFNGAAWVAGDVSLPQDIVLSFAGRSMALIDAIDLYLPDGVTAPALIDVAVVAGEANAGWQRVGRYALRPTAGWSTACDKVCFGAQRMSFPPVLARAVRLTVIKMWGDGPVGIGEIVVHEGKRNNYSSLLPYRRPGFTGGIDIANIALGGSIESAIPPAEYSDNSPDRLINGIPEGNGYWAPENDLTTPQIVLSFNNKRSALIGGIAFTPNGGYSNFSTPKNVRWTSLVDIWTSDESPTSGYRWAGRFRIDQADRTQVFAFEPVRAKYLRVLLLATQRPFPSGPVLGKIEVLETSAPDYTSILADRSPNLLDFRFGGHVAVPFGTRRSDLIDSTIATPGWFADSNDLPVTLTFGFYHGQKRRIGAIGFNPKTDQDPASWVRRVKVLVSDHPLRGFEAVGEFELAQQDQLQYFDIGPVEARYVQIRLIETAGSGKGVSLGEVAVREAPAPGELSAVARRVDPLPEESATADSATAGWKAELSEA
jgi:hypothetical protein